MSQKNCYAHDLKCVFDDDYYVLYYDSTNYFCGDYALLSIELSNYIKPLIGNDKEIEIDDMPLERFKSIIIPLKEDLHYIYRHSDYNSYDYEPGSEEMWNRINEGYVELFKLIKTLV